MNSEEFKTVIYEKKGRYPFIRDINPFHANAYVEYLKTNNVFKIGKDKKLIISKDTELWYNFALIPIDMYTEELRLFDLSNEESGNLINIMLDELKFNKEDQSAIKLLSIIKDPTSTNYVKIKNNIVNTIVPTAFNSIIFNTSYNMLKKLYLRSNILSQYMRNQYINPLFFKYIVSRLDTTYNTDINCFDPFGYYGDTIIGAAITPIVKKLTYLSNNVCDITQDDDELEEVYKQMLDDVDLDRKTKIIYDIVGQKINFNLVITSFPNTSYDNIKELLTKVLKMSSSCNNFFFTLNPSLESSKTDIQKLMKKYKFIKIQELKFITDIGYLYSK